MAEQVKERMLPVSRARAVAFVGLSVALIAASAWISVPIGPVPFTLQMLSITLIICLLRPSEAIAAIYLYVALGAIGLPVFSGMRGGIGVLMGTTGGYLIGYLIGVPLAVGLLALVRRRIAAKQTETDTPSTDKELTAGDITRSHGLVSVLRSGAWEVAAGVLFTAVSYTCGLIQYMAVAGVGFEVAFGVSAAPFIIPDIAKIVFAVLCAQAVGAALGSIRAPRR